MYRLANTAKGKKYTYYRCHGDERNPSKCQNMIRLEELDAQLDKYVTTNLSRWPRYEVVTVPGHGHDDEIAEVEYALRDLDYDPDFADKQAALLAERAPLKSLPMRPTVTDKRPAATPSASTGRRWKATRPGAST
jgi:hypothetical protein